MPWRLTISEYGNNESPADILDYRDLQAKIADILERLPEKCGKIFCMSRFEGLNIQRSQKYYRFPSKQSKQIWEEHLRNSEKHWQNNERDEKHRKIH